jgi:lambda family phage portal protein
MGLIDWMFKRTPEPKVTKKRGYAAAANVARYGDLKSSRGSADYELREGLAEVRSKIRFLARNSSSLKRYISLMRTNIVGVNGFRLQCRVRMTDGRMDVSLNTRVQDAWEDFCAAPTTCGTLHMIDLTRQAVASWCRDGEVIWELVESSRYTHGIAINPLEADHLDETLNSKYEQTNNEIRMGVEINAQNQPVAYHFLTSHPGDVSYYSPMTRRRYRRVPADRVIHVYEKLRPGQTRGEPPASSTVHGVKMLDGYREAETMGRRLRSALMGFFQKMSQTTAGIDELADDVDDADEVFEMNMEPGRLKSLPTGYEFKQFDPGGSQTDYKDFESQAKKDIAMGVNISTMSHGMEVEGVSYSSGRTVAVEDRDYYKEMQGFFIRNMMTPVFRRWVVVSTLYHDAWPPSRRDAITRSGKFRSRGWDWVDPAKDIRANAEALATGQTSLTQIAAQRGMDRDELLDEIQDDMEAARSRGLPVEQFFGMSDNVTSDVSDDDEDSESDG